MSFYNSFSNTSVNKTVVNLEIILTVCFMTSISFHQILEVCPVAQSLERYL